jgi:A/G-specific adenine glycosylase
MNRLLWDRVDADVAAMAPALRGSLLSWWELHGRRELDQKPWMVTGAGRWPESGEAIDCFGVLVAEVMLQQTQLAVVLPYWRRWMAVFPDLEVLAAADEQRLLLLWQGLGYYSRARRLLQAARQLVPAMSMDQRASTTPPWPTSLAGWQALPGLGRSTAASILSSAFDQPEAILDGNVKRVLARLIAAPAPPARQLAGFWRLSETLLDRRRPRSFNQAVMDLGATVCTPRNPRCEVCPWRGWCAAYAAGDPARYPVKEAPRTVPFQVIGVGVVFDNAGRVLIDQRHEEGLLGGLWEFPGGKQEEGEAITATIERELAEELAIAVEVGEELIVIEHAYSHKRLQFVVHLCRWQAGEPQPLASQQVRWVEPAELDAYPFPAANARIIAALRLRLAELAAPEGASRAQSGGSRSAA